MSGYQFATVHTVASVLHALGFIACLVLAIINGDKYRQEIQGHVANARFLRDHYNMAAIACMMFVFGSAREGLLAAGMRPFSDPQPVKNTRSAEASARHYEHIGTRSTIAHLFTILWQVTSFWLLAQVSFVTEIGALLAIVVAVFMMEQLLFVSKSHVARKTGLAYTNVACLVGGYLLIWFVIIWHADRAFEHQATAHADTVLLPFLVISIAFHGVLYFLRVAQVFGEVADADNPETERKWTAVHWFTLVLALDSMLIAFTTIFRLSYSADNFIL